MNNRPRKIPWFRIAIGILILFSIGLLLFLVGLAAGSVSGTEFSPDNFSMRSFRYTRLPLVGWTIRGRRFDDIDLSVDLIQDGFITPQPIKQWHLVSEGSFSSNNQNCDARFLIQLLNLKTSSDLSSYWIEWNEKYPDHAKTFWPLVAELARDELYLVLPELVEIPIGVDRVSQAKGGGDLAALDSTSQPSIIEIEAFRTALHDQIARAYELYGSIDLELGRVERSAYRINKSKIFSSMETEK